ncbi:DUF2059 domain-containing protein [Stenotrophomonas sp. PS02289]|uniref:DUF2059 domain-containing protein n=1 Tax=Stenotrophomonas sp. PS02289 TaxID=2991422 RepID=UPI00249A16EE|nr:DUF2059 domain-containing protein [Stenotrophomonas sp. PS02289]
MTCRQSLLIVLLALAGCTDTATVQLATDTLPEGSPGASLVQRFNMGQGLRGLALDAARATTTYAALAQQLGKAAADQQVQAQLDRHLSHYQAAWDYQLADLYAQHLSTEELRSLAREGTRSPFAAKFNTVQPVLAAQMQTQSRPLTAELVTKALATEQYDRPTGSVTDAP